MTETRYTARKYLLKMFGTGRYMGCLESDLTMNHSIAFIYYYDANKSFQRFDM